MDLDLQLAIELGERLKIARKRRRWSQRSLAERAGVSRQTIERMEAGDANVALSRWLVVLRTLGLPMAPWDSIADPGTDALGLSMELQRAPGARRGVDPRDLEDFTIV